MRIRFTNTGSNKRKTATSREGTYSKLNNGASRTAAHAATLRTIPLRSARLRFRLLGRCRAHAAPVELRPVCHFPSSPGLTPSSCPHTADKVKGIMSCCSQDRSRQLCVLSLETLSSSFLELGFRDLARQSQSLATQAFRWERVQRVRPLRGLFEFLRPSLLSSRSARIDLEGGALPLSA